MLRGTSEPVHDQNIGGIVSKKTEVQKSNDGHALMVEVGVKIIP